MVVKKIEHKNVILSNKDIKCSSIEEDIASLTAKFIICSFDVNLNNVQINRATIGNWIQTLVSQPVVAKISVQDSGFADFTAHNMSETVRVDEDGNPYITYEFDSSACGVFTSVQIENIGGKEYITATAKLWKRFPEFCAVVKKRMLEGTLSTSWEIATIASHIEMINGKKVKIIDEGQFIGHSLLSKYIPAAYPESRLLEVAQACEAEDSELFAALNKDIINEAKNNETNPEKEADTLPIEDNKNENSNELPDTEESGTGAESTDTSIMTEYDLRKSLREAIAVKLGDGVSVWDFYIIYHFPANGALWIQMWDASSELDIISFTYTVGEDDSITLSEPVNCKLTVSVSQINETISSHIERENELSEALVKANNTIQALTTEVSNLTPFREKAEKAEREKIEAEQKTKIDELKAYAVSSNLISDVEISEVEEIKNAINRLDKTAINNIIAERFMRKQVAELIDSAAETKNKKDTKPDTSEKSLGATEAIKASLYDDDDVIPKHRKFINSYINN
jgi:hypothetical protein